MLALLLLALQAGNVSARVLQAPLPEEQRGAILTALSAKDYTKIESLLAAAASADAAHGPEIYALLGAIDFVGQRMPQAVQAFRRSGSLPERDRFTLAMALVSLGEIGEARAELTRLSSARPDQPLYFYWLGRLDYDQRRYEDAVAKLRRVVEMDPRSSRGYDNLGLSLDMLGRYEEARSAFERAADLNRRVAHPSAWPPHNLGSLLLRLDKLPEAEAALRESLRFDPGFAQAHYHLGRVLEKAGRETAAIGEYRQAISLDASLPEPCYSLGLLYRRLKRSAEADAAFTEYNRRKRGANLRPAPSLAR